MNIRLDDPHLLKAKAMSDFSLRIWLAYNEGSPMWAAATTELERRKFRRNFLTNGIASWLALIISTLSLLVSTYAAYFKNTG